MAQSSNSFDRSGNELDCYQELESVGIVCARLFRALGVSLLRKEIAWK